MMITDGICSDCYNYNDMVKAMEVDTPVTKVKVKLFCYDCNTDRLLKKYSN